jgi:AcrR family transcriptional regulator
MSTKTPRHYLSQDERRTQLLELGLSLFGARSYEDISIEELAQQAGISKGLMYHYFGSKRAFYTEVVRLAASRLLETIEPDPNLSGPDNIRRGLTSYFAFVQQHAEPYLALMHGGIGVDDLVHNILEEARRNVIHHILIGAGVEEPQLPQLATLRLAIRSWIGGVEAAALHWMEQRDVPIPTIIDMLAASLIVQLAAAARRVEGVRLSLDLASAASMILQILATSA